MLKTLVNTDVFDRLHFFDFFTLAGSRRVLPGLAGSPRAGLIWLPLGLLRPRLVAFLGSMGTYGQTRRDPARPGENRRDSARGGL